MERRVVITGIGLVTPLGIGVVETWSALIAGKSGIAEITKFDTEGYATRIAAEVKNFNAEDFLPKKEARRTQPFLAYAQSAARMAVDDSGLTIDAGNQNRVGVITGCGLGGLSWLEHNYTQICEKRPQTGESLSDPADDRKYGARHDFDPVRRQGAQFIYRHRLCRRFTRSRRCLQCHPARCG